MLTDFCSGSMDHLETKLNQTVEALRRGDVWDPDYWLHTLFTNIKQNNGGVEYSQEKFSVHFSRAMKYVYLTNPVVSESIEYLLYDFIPLILGEENRLLVNFGIEGFRSQSFFEYIKNNILEFSSSMNNTVPRDVINRIMIGVSL